MPQDMSNRARILNVVSLFSGGGGMALGFMESGFKLLLATDLMPEAEATHKINWKNIPFICQDISTITREQLFSVIGNRKLDVLIGGPPCQGFSNMGDKSGSDPRNNLVEEYLKMVAWLQPTCVLMENVMGMKTKYNGFFYNTICNTLSHNGYDIYSKVLNAFDYSVPQIRKRIFIFGTRKGMAFEFPGAAWQKIGQLTPRKTVWDAIKDLASKNEGINNHSVLRHGEIVLARYKLVPEGGKLPKPEHLPVKIRRKNFGNTYERLHREKPATTMVPGNNAFPIHPTLDRSLSPREAARIQSFPDNHVFAGNRSAQCKLVGNAVPPLLAANLAKTIAAHILRGKSGVIDNISQSLGKDLVCKRHESLMMEDGQRHESGLTFVDLFAGVGGITQGFKQAGLKCLLSVDIDPHASEAYRINHPTDSFIQGDLADKKVEKTILDNLEGKKVNILVGGPPCQGFSIFGARRFIKTRKFDPLKDSRNDLVKAFWDYAKLLKPDWVIMENVPGFMSLLDGHYLEKTITMAKKYGYKNIEYKILNAADHGVPQIRKRFVLIATNTDYVIPWPKPKYFENPEEWQNPYRTVGEVLTGIDDPSAYEKLPNHIPPKHAKMVIKRFSYIKEGQKLDPDNLPATLKMGLKTKKEIDNFSHVFKRLDRFKPSSTMVPGHNAFPIHPWLNRTLTIREAARLQTFPDRYIFKGPIIKQGMQVGNAFPCLLAQVIAERLSRVVKNKWTDHTITDLAKYSMITVEK